MNRTSSSLLAGCLLAALTVPAAAQTSRSDPTDLQSWQSVGLNFNLPNRWEAGLKYRARFVDNSTVFRGSYLYAEVGRELSKHFSALSEYRLALVDDGTHHRLGLGMQADANLGKTEVSLRPLLQYQKQVFEDEGDGTDADAYLRTRFKVEHPVTKALDVYVATEPYLKFGVDSPLDNVRNTVGLQLEYAKRRKAELFYIYRPDYGKSYNRTFHVIGVDLDFDFKIGGSKKKDKKKA
jgi:hypothetical protein